MFLTLPCLYCLGEATLFEEGVRKHGKEFLEIQQDYVSSRGFPFYLQVIMVLLGDQRAIASK